MYHIQKQSYAKMVMCDKLLARNKCRYACQCKWEALCSPETSKNSICDCMHVVPHYADLHFSLHGAPLCRHNYFKVCRMVNLP